MSASPNRKHVSFNADTVRTEVFGRRNEWKYQGLSSPPQEKNEEPQATYNEWELPNRIRRPV